MVAPNRTTKKYSMPELILGNGLIIIWVGLGAVSFGIFVSLAGLAYFSVLAFLIFFEMGKHGCVSCFYCSSCTIGMGKLPEFFFKSKGDANVNRKAQKIFRLVYVLLSLVPISLTVFSMVQELVIYKAALLLSISGFSIYSGIVRRRTLAM